MKAKELGLELDGQQMGTVLDQLKELEHAGYHFEASGASLELLMRRATGWRNPFFACESFRVIVEHRPRASDGAAENPMGHYDGVDTEATVKLIVDGERIMAVGEGKWPGQCLGRGNASSYWRSLSRPGQDSTLGLQGPDLGYQ